MSSLSFLSVSNILSISGNELLLPDGILAAKRLIKWHFIEFGLYLWSGL